MWIRRRILTLFQLLWRMGDNVNLIGDAFRTNGEWNEMKIPKSRYWISRDFFNYKKIHSIRWPFTFISQFAYISNITFDKIGEPPMVTHILYLRLCNVRCRRVKSCVIVVLNLTYNHIGKQVNTELNIYHVTFILEFQLQSSLSFLLSLSSFWSSVDVCKIHDTNNNNT